MTQARAPDLEHQPENDNYQEQCAEPDIYRGFLLISSLPVVTQKLFNSYREFPSFCATSNTAGDDWGGRDLDWVSIPWTCLGRSLRVRQLLFQLSHQGLCRRFLRHLLRFFVMGFTFPSRRSRWTCREAEGPGVDTRAVGLSCTFPSGPLWGPAFSLTDQRSSAA